MVLGLLHYIAWATTLVCCSTAFFSTNKGGSNNTITNSDGVQLSLFFPLDVYAWSVAQTLTTLGILRPISEVLTHEAWKSFEKRDPSSKHENTNNASVIHPIGFLPPTEIPVLDVQKFLGRENDASAALCFLEQTYGPRWYERPLLLRGLWTIEELLPAASTPSTTKRRQLNPVGLLNITDLVIPYFSDATKHGALEPDASDPVGDIVRRMIEEEKPHKIGSQLVIQNNPSLMEEVAPLGFVRSLFGNHFSPDHLMGNPHRRGIHRFFPGTTTVPLFIANTRAVRSNTGASPGPPGKDTSADGDCPAPTEDGTAGGGSESGNGSCPNPRSRGPIGDDDAGTSSIPVTGLHCEPIANVAVQLWGSRTWTLVDPEHSWKLRPSISRDGRSFYPSWISPVALETTVPRYVTTTTPGDALWLPTWTYHKVSYVYDRDDDRSESGAARGANDPHALAHAQLHEHHLSIGASLFHFRPVDYVRRNPLFALLLIPSLIRELAGISTQ